MEKMSRDSIFLPHHHFGIWVVKNSKLDNIILYFSYSSSTAAEKISFRPLFM